MRSILIAPALVLCLAAPTMAQSPKFLKVDIVSKSMRKHIGEDGPKEVHIRMPLALAKGFLGTIADQGIHINGSVEKGGKAQKIQKTQKLKMDQLVKLLEASKAGDMLLEVTTDTGDLVKVVVE